VTIPDNARALTIRQPWASLIALGVKTIETRSWSTRYRGPLAIHAGKAPTSFAAAADPWRRLAAETGQARPWYEVTLGAVVAVADLVDVVPMLECGTFPDPPGRYLRIGRPGHGPRLALGAFGRPRSSVTDQEPYGDFTPGRYAWLLDNVREIDPVPAKGRQGLWTWEDTRG